MSTQVKEIDLAAVLERYPELRTMHHVDVQTLVEMSEFLTRVPDDLVEQRVPSGEQRHLRDRRDRCNCQMFIVLLNRSGLTFKYPGMQSIATSVKPEDKIVEPAYLECKRCGYRYPITSIGYGYKPPPEGKDRVIRVRRRGE